VNGPLALAESVLRGGGGVKWGAVEPDVTPAWVADMDFGVPDAVREAMSVAVECEQFGYPYHPEGDPLVRAFEDRMRRHHGWAPMAGRTRVFTDLIQVLQVVIEHTTEPGDGVALHVPTYPPFLASIQRAHRRIVPLGVTDTEDGWELETEGLAERFAAEGVRLVVLVNPHNPTGRVLDRVELERIAEAARLVDVPVLADEIHADLVHDGRTHVPFASLGPDAAARTITATSATKAFNIAGLRCAVAHVGWDPLWDALEAAPLDYFGQPSTIGRIATVAAWDGGDAWLERVRGVLAVNRALVADWAASHEGLLHHRPDATYLSWVGFGATAIGDAPARHVLDRGRVLLSEGSEFAQHTDVSTGSFARINFATGTERVARILNGIDAALAGR